MAELGFSDLLSLVQTVAIIAALVVTLYFSRRQVRALAVDLESRVLNEIDEKFHRIGEVFIERPELVSTIYRLPTTPDVEVPFTYSLLFFCAHIFHMRERHLLADNEWDGWFQWMRNAFAFGTIGRSWTEGRMGPWFDPAFQAFVEKELLRPTK